MITVTQAIDLLLETRPGWPGVTAPLSGACGAILAKDVIAEVTLPPRDASAMDGYAVKLTDIHQEGAELTLIGEAPAGTPFNGTIGSGQTVRIFTGGAVPDGADHIVIQENVTRDGGRIIVNESASEPRHIRRAGIDFNKGDVLIAKGTRLLPAHIALAAAGNHSHLPIEKRPVIALLANGDELVPPGAAKTPGDIISSNPAGLRPLIEGWGGEILNLPIAKDDPEDINNIINQARDADIIVPIGGASVGDHDHMRHVFKSRGLKSVFEKIAVRPGKPTWFGTMGEQLVLGLPGNPASSTVCAYLFLQSLISGRSAIKIINARVTENIAANGPRETFLRSRAFIDDQAVLQVTPFPRQDSSLLTPFPQSNGFIQLPANAGPWAQGDTIGVILLGTGPDI